MDNNFTENYESLKEVTHEFDSNYGDLLNLTSTLKHINTGVGRIVEDVREADITNMESMALHFREVYHRIEIIGQLLHYITKDMNQELDKTEILKERYFDLIVRAEVEEGMKKRQDVRNPNACQ